ncbi:recombinase family protein [Bradyrhizobium sp. Arg816]|uniref:recombinase family protein n=1 Tax=Bradyrhizobium sp. Arg816 TaxID=2998491 RepID=UPI0034D6134D
MTNDCRRTVCGHPRVAARAANRRPDFVVRRRSQASIVRLLNNEQVPNHRGTSWSEGMIRNIMSDEAYISNSVYTLTRADNLMLNCCRRHRSLPRAFEHLALRPSGTVTPK